MLILLTAIIFYFIGRYSINSQEQEKKQIKQLIKKQSAGVIEHYTEKELQELEEDEQEQKVWDKALGRFFK